MTPKRVYIDSDRSEGIVIVCEYSDNSLEDIDTAEDMNEASFLVAEYSLAFGV